MNSYPLTREPRLLAVETAEDVETEVVVAVATEVVVEEEDRMVKSVEEDVVREVLVAEEVEVVKMGMESLIDMKASLVKKLTQWIRSQVLAVEEETKQRMVTEEETGELTRELPRKEETRLSRILKTE